MRPTQSILARRHLPGLAGLALSNVLLAFEYDGVLAPLVADPGRARMRVRTRRLLARAATCYPCVVISSRSRRDLANHLRDTPVWFLLRKRRSALRQALDVFACDTAIYVAHDPDTDPAADVRQGPLVVRVGRAPASDVRFHLASQREIDDLLRTLVTLRVPSATRGRPRRPFVHAQADARQLD